MAPRSEIPHPVFPGWYVLDRDHNPVPEPDPVKAAEYFSSPDGLVQRTDLGSSHISTVFLALDHNLSRQGPPVLFETLVHGGPLGGHMQRYASWQEAEEGHRQIVQMCMDALGDGVEPNPKPRDFDSWHHDQLPTWFEHILVNEDD